MPSVEVVNCEKMLVTGSGLSNFSLIENAPYDKSFVVSVNDVVGGYELEVTPLTPAGTYVLSYEDGGLEGTVVFEVPTDVLNPDGKTVASSMPREFGILEALTFAVGRELQATGGVPATRTVKNFGPGSSILFVKSTLGFPESGSIFADGIKLIYQKKSDTSFFLGDYKYVSVQAGAIVTSDVKSIEIRSKL